jgi:hypothetical protein
VDFQCHSNERSFFVETTTITIPIATSRTGLSHGIEDSGPKFYGTAIKNEVIQKSKQVAGLDRPALIFVTTLHWELSAIGLQTHHLEELLVGSSVITASLSRETGSAVGSPRNEATFDHSLFFESRTNVPRRQHFSGVLVGGFGLLPPDCQVKGVLHPQPARPFDPRCLSDACFGSIQPWPLSAQSRIIWRKACGTLCDDEAETEQRLEKARRRLSGTPLWEEIQRDLRNRKSADP